MSSRPPTHTYQYFLFFPKISLQTAQFSEEFQTMQTFNESLKFFQQQEHGTGSLQEMEKSSHKHRVRSERARRKSKRLSCIDKALFDEPVSR
jgi:hypothetical protein